MAIRGTEDPREFKLIAGAWVTVTGSDLFWTPYALDTSRVICSCSLPTLLALPVTAAGLLILIPAMILSVRRWRGGPVPWWLATFALLYATRRVLHYVSGHG